MRGPVLVAEKLLKKEDKAWAVSKELWAGGGATVRVIFTKGFPPGSQVCLPSLPFPGP